MNPARTRAVLFGLALAALAVGCQSLRVREIEDPVAETTLMVARGAEETTVSWMAQRNMRYTVMYANSRRAGSKWQPLPGAVSIVGRGAMVTILDAVPAGQPRFYRLDITPASGRRP